MDTAGWALAIIGAVAVVFAIVKFVLDQIPGLTDSFVRAAASVRDAKVALRADADSSEPALPVGIDAGSASFAADRGP